MQVHEIESRMLRRSSMMHGPSVIQFFIAQTAEECHGCHHSQDLYNTHWDSNHPNDVKVLFQKILQFSKATLLDMKYNKYKINKYISAILYAAGSSRGRSIMCFNMPESASCTVTSMSVSKSRQFKTCHMSLLLWGHFSIIRSVNKALL